MDKEKSSVKCRNGKKRKREKGKVEPYLLISFGFALLKKMTDHARWQ